MRIHPVRQLFVYFSQLYVYFYKLFIYFYQLTIYFNQLFVFFYEMLCYFYQLFVYFYKMFVYFHYMVVYLLNLSADLMASAPNLEELSLAYNILRDVPSGTFDQLNFLKIVNLYGNMLAFLGPETFRGVADTVEVRIHPVSCFVYLYQLFVYFLNLSTSILASTSSPASGRSPSPPSSTSTWSGTASPT